MKVTAFLKYDLYPYYVVLEGDLQENFDVKTSCGTYSRGKVMCVRPIDELDKHREARNTVTKEYDRLHRQLKIDVLRQNGVNFINTDNF